MTILAPFAASEVKVGRAEKHLAELRSEIDSYFARGAVQIVVEIAEEYGQISAGMRALVYREKEPIPTPWSAIVGYVLHNIRAAYDLLACDVHRITGGKPEDTAHVHYPFCKTQADLNATIKKQRLHRVANELRTLLENTAPYRGGNNGLRAVHDLDILDKHQALLPVVSIASLPWPVPIVEGPQMFTTKLSVDGQRIMIMPQSYMPISLGDRVDAQFQMVFGSEGPFNGQPLVGQLVHCIGYTREIIKVFRVGAAQLGLIANDAR